MASPADTTLVRGSKTREPSDVSARISAIAELTANCEHGSEMDRGEFIVGGSGTAIRWRIMFCEPCWEHFTDHQEVIDLRYFEDFPTESSPT